MAKLTDLNSVREYRFDDQLMWSEGVADRPEISNILLSNIPGATYVRKATAKEDRMGTDYWVDRADAPALSVDVKSRSLDPVTDLSQSSDDLALETWSVMESGKVGWTWDMRKRTDFILWLFESTGRWVLIPFPMLCKAMLENKEVWATKYRLATQSSNGGQWHSQCVFVPRQEVWRAIYRIYGGTHKPPNSTH